MRPQPRPPASPGFESIPPLPASAVNVEITDGTIRLRPFRQADALALYTATLETLDMLRSWMTWCSDSYSINDCIAFISRTGPEWEADRSYSLAITEAGKDFVLGSIAINKVNRTHSSANVGYWVRMARAGQGIASRALNLAAGFAFTELGLGRLEIVVPLGNVASQRVAQKAGASFEGLHRNKLVLHGQAHDAFVYAMVNPARGGGKLASQ